MKGGENEQSGIMRQFQEVKPSRQGDAHTEQEKTIEDNLPIAHTLHSPTKKSTVSKGEPLPD